MKRKKENNFLIIALIGLGILFYEKNKKGIIKVNPLINFDKFKSWYYNTIGDYYDDNTIPNLSEWFDYWINNINNK